MSLFMLSSLTFGAEKGSKGESFMRAFGMREAKVTSRRRAKATVGLTNVASASVNLTHVQNTPYTYGK